MSDENGIKWLVEERDRLKARCEVLENELVRRDGAPPMVEEHFHVELTPEEVRMATILGESTRAIADKMVDMLSRHIVSRSLHRISVSPEGAYRLCFLSPTWKPT